MIPVLAMEGKILFYLYFRDLRHWKKLLGSPDLLYDWILFSVYLVGFFLFFLFTSVMHLTQTAICGFGIEHFQNGTMQGWHFHSCPAASTVREYSNCGTQTSSCARGKLTLEGRTRGSEWCSEFTSLSPTGRCCLCRLPLFLWSAVSVSQLAGGPKL